MNININPLYGQSNLDICLKAVGELDNYVKFCNGNNILDLSTPITSIYSFDSNSIKNKIITNKNYATRYFSKEGTDGAYDDAYGGGYG